MRSVIFLLAILAFWPGFSPVAQAGSAGQPKEWTFLIFLNGNNNLDSFGTLNLNQMEKVGSTSRINIVVQWASLKTRTVKRMLIRKDNDPARVTSPVIEDMGRVDMGDWRSVVNFVKWGVEQFPAEKYFLDIWDHGSGWHAKNNGIGNPAPMDISWDDLTGNHITTNQLAMALEESAKIIGHKIDIYGSDACLMAMIEIAAEVRNSVGIYAGSEENEPGAGWPYDALLNRWNSLPDATPALVAKALSEEYGKSYRSTNDAVTFSVFDLERLPAVNGEIRRFTDSIRALDGDSVRKFVEAAKRSQSFAVSDYVDFLDFLANLKAARIPALAPASIDRLALSVRSLIIANDTVRFPRANGVSIWIPTAIQQYARYADLYSRMQFDRETRWGDLLATMLK